MNVIQLPQVHRSDRHPEPEFCTSDRNGRTMFRFLADYQIDGRTFGISFWAYDLADAERRVASMRANLSLQGQIFCRM
ncbi:MULTISPECIES: hypothetical protein [unclassified Rhizobium]|uniref:hypothetical protein n=1 Tax=unclassified Rhizobium TaxID=2613769 RepID=UPI00254E4BBC|nr:hypothetical protein [Rhizobium sp. CNPSo 4062]MDK4702237.1 hypothetical protein [Rhizobium sp. CNPSo 4062]